MSLGVPLFLNRLFSFSELSICREDCGLFSQAVRPVLRPYNSFDSPIQSVCEEFVMASEVTLTLLQAL